MLRDFRSLTTHEEMHASFPLAMCLGKLIAIPRIWAQLEELSAGSRATA